MSFLTGTVIAWRQIDIVKGEGFIRPDDERVHLRAVVFFNASAANYSPIRCGDRVQYTTRKAPFGRHRFSYQKKPQANQVKKIEGDET